MRTPRDIEAWIVAHLADELALERDEVDVHKPFDRLGVDSVVAVAMTGELEEWLGKRVSPEVVLEHETVARLAAHLAR